MRRYIRRVAVAAAYQLTVAMGLLLFPLALVLRRTVGVRLPVHRLLDRVLDAYESDLARAR